MFDVLIYVYETYYRPDACPDPVVLTKKLSAVGFEEDEITQALNWLAPLTQKDTSTVLYPTQQTAFSFGTRIYHERELQALGVEAIGFIQFLELATVLNPNQREIVIERALAVEETPIPLDELKVIVLLVLWSQDQEPDILVFDELFANDDEKAQEVWH